MAGRFGHVDHSGHAGHGGHTGLDNPATSRRYRRQTA